MLEAVGDVAFGVHQQLARQTDNALIRTTASRWRQLGDGSFGDVNADDGEVAIVELPNVGAPTAGGGLRSIGVRVRADAFCENHSRILL